MRKWSVGEHRSISWVLPPFFQRSNPLRAAILFPLLGLAVGSGIGAVVGYQQYGLPASEFGPFSPEKPVSLADVDAYRARRGAAGSPKVEVVGDSEHDFGVMQRDAESSHQFVVKNVGTAPLEMAVTGSTCKCTVGKLEKESLAPGESTMVNMEWSAKTNSGTFSQSATLRTNDPAVGELQLVVRGNVVDTVAVEPQSWNIGDVEASEPFELKTTLYNHSEQPLEIVDVRWVDERFDAASTIDFQSRPVDSERDGVHSGAREAVEFAIDVAPGARQSSINQTLRIRYRTADGDESHPPVELVLTGRTVDALSVFGGSRLSARGNGIYDLRIGQVKKGEQKEEKVHVVLRGRYKDTARLSVAEVEPAAAIEAELGEPSERNTMVLLPLSVRIRADAPEIERSGKNEDDYGFVVVESDNPTIAPIRIRLTFGVGTSAVGL